MYTNLDGKADALSVGGNELDVHMDGQDYPIRAAPNLVQDVHLTPPEDGGMLKNALEGRPVELSRKLSGEQPRYEGRSFGINLSEGALTASSGKGCSLSIAELNSLIDELEMRPTPALVRD